MLLEICVGSLEDCRTALEQGADRLELCGSLELGGLTPSLGLVERVVAEIDLPVIVMVRPRAAGFCYTDDEFQVMVRDAELIFQAGASGIVFGVLREDASIDQEQVLQLTKLAGDRETVFHRAFDFVSDKPAALETLIELGVSRILTTGGGASALEGVRSLHQLGQQAAGRIEIMPGGGVDATNIIEIVEVTGCQQFHAGCSRSTTDPSLSLADAASLCDQRRIEEGTYRGVHGERIATLRALLSS